MKKIKLIYSCLVILGVFYACDDLLDKAPLDKIGNDSYWNSSKDLEKYMLSFYTSFSTFTNNNAGSYLGIFGLDAREGSDHMLNSTPHNTINGASGVVTTGGNWSWNSIRSVNFFFDNYTKCKDNFDLYKHFLGEAYFFKAYFYFDKVKAYGDIPWFTHTLEMDSPELFAERTPRTQVVDSILFCLDKATEYLTPLSNNSYGGSNRLSKEAALIFKSRVALYEGTWQKYHANTVFGTPGAEPVKYFKAAADAGEELMSGKYAVNIYNTGNPNQDYGSLFGQLSYTGINEVVLWAAYSNTLNLTHKAQTYLTLGTNDVHVSFNLVSSYLTKEGDIEDYTTLAKSYTGNDFLNKIAEDCDPRLKQTIWTPGDVMWNNKSYGKKLFTLPYLTEAAEFKCLTGFQLRKGVNPLVESAGAPFSGNPSETGSIVFRYAEALLNYAEAKCELGESVDYDKSINLLRQRAGMPKFSIPASINATSKIDYGYSVSDELYEIRRERAVELACEGFRAMDYKRWRAHKLFQGKRLSGYPFKEDEWNTPTSIPVNTDGFLDPHAEKAPSGYKFRENQDYLQCIPTNEITLNPNLKQNPGWDNM